MMQSMDSYGGQEKPGYKVGYVPPEGNAGPGAKGVYGHDSNPLRVPMKGSSIGAGYGNADRLKSMRLKDEQLRKENLRGQAC